MKREAFTLLHDMESSWWYRGRAVIVQSALSRSTGAMQNEEALDFGAGYGGMYEVLRLYCANVYASEPDALARTESRTRGYIDVFASDEEALVRRYSLVGMFDVVEHTEDDSAGVRNIAKALVSGGYVAITVPAFQFLWSVHDVNHHHFRRYAKTTITKLLEQNGFEVVFISYWNMTLFIPAALLRLFGHSGESSLALPAFLDALCLTLIRIEAFLLRFASLPFGTGLVVVARKKG